MSSNPVESYLKDLGEIYRTGGGVAEESYYGPLETLLNEIGRKLKPARRCWVAFGSPRFWVARALDAHYYVD